MKFKIVSILDTDLYKACIVVVPQNLSAVMLTQLRSSQCNRLFFDTIPLQKLYIASRTGTRTASSLEGV